MEEVREQVEQLAVEIIDLPQELVESLLQEVGNAIGHEHLRKIVAIVPLTVAHIRHDPSYCKRPAGAKIAVSWTKAVIYLDPELPKLFAHEFGHVLWYLSGMEFNRAMWQLLNKASQCWIPLERFADYPETSGAEAFARVQVWSENPSDVWARLFETFVYHHAVATSGCSLAAHGLPMPGYWEDEAWKTLEPEVAHMIHKMVHRID